MTKSERKRCEAQLKGMDTDSLKELATMMELANETEHEALDMAMRELLSRGVKIEKLVLIERADAIPIEPD